MDVGSLGGILLALAGILAGLLLEGGHLSQVLQPTAAIIVFGGTFGAVMLQFPLKTVFSAAGRLARGGRRLRLRLATHWPWAGQITAAAARLQALPSG